MATYALRGTYSDGEVRHMHVTTSNMLSYAHEHLRGILPFEKIETRICNDGLDCNCHDRWDDKVGRFTFRVAQA